jgi:hypothetical protein
MKKFLKIIGALMAVGILGVIAIVLLMPSMDRWGATQTEIGGSFTGDELVPSPRITYTRAISINAKPEEIYPWIVQLGAEKGGMYSYSWFETNILQCELINADRIHPEWQNLKVGDPMKMCPGTSGPPPYEIAILKPNQSIVMGHKEAGAWIEAWQFNLVPQNDGTTRLVIRSRSAAQGWFWDLIRPGEFVMMRGMMLGIKERAEQHIFQTNSQPTVSMAEFGQTISLSYDSTLASRTEIHTISAVPFNDQTFYAGTHPTYAQISFPDFLAGQKYQLPVLATENVPQVMVFQTADFHGFGDDSPQGFPQQFNALTNLLKTSLEPTRCAELLTYESALPFLPWINEMQTLCAQPQIVEFANGKGIRYLAYYSQGVDPVMEGMVFYTFQGITDDGKFYVAALFPIRTGIFPTEPPACPKCSDPNYDYPAEWKDTITKQLNQLNAQAGDQFTPSLEKLDELIRSIQIGEQG